MSARDEAACLLAEDVPRSQHDSGCRSWHLDERIDKCDCWVLRQARKPADRLAAAGLLRPDPTGEDREVALGLIKHHVNPAIGSLRRVDRDGGNTTAALNALIAAFDNATDAILAAGFSRPRGPVTETPAPTPEQVEAAAAAIYEIDPLPNCGDGSWAAALDKTTTSPFAASIVDDTRDSARAALTAALGLSIEVLAGEDR